MRKIKYLLTNNSQDEVRIWDDQEAGSDEPVIHKDDQVINGDDFIFTPSPYGHTTGISRLRIRATDDHCL